MFLCNVKYYDEKNACFILSFRIREHRLHHIHSKRDIVYGDWLSLARDGNINIALSSISPHFETHPQTVPPDKGIIFLLVYYSFFFNVFYLYLSKKLLVIIDNEMSCRVSRFCKTKHGGNI